MDSTITLPVWLAALLALLSLALLLDRVLIPSVRWYLRRRINRVIDQIGGHDNFPKRFSLEQQGRFVIGFHHEKADAARRIALEYKGPRLVGDF